LENAFRLLLERNIEGLQMMEALATRGSLMSHLYCAEAHRTGIVSQVDLTQSAKWFQRASDDGCPYASYRLGRLYFTDRQYFYAKQYFERGVRDDYAPAICMMGFLYSQGLGVSKDWDKAREYLEKATAQGNLLAKGVLASLLIRRRWGLVQMVRGIYLFVAGFIETLLVNSNSPRQI
jgi:hypothetical protein